jgi:hypothetical protein
MPNSGAKRVIPYSTQIPQPCAPYKEAEVLYCGCMYDCRFNQQAPKDIIALTSKRFAAAGNMQYCFNLLPAESAGRVPFKQTHSTVPWSKKI